MPQGVRGAVVLDTIDKLSAVKLEPSLSGRLLRTWNPLTLFYGHTYT